MFWNNVKVAIRNLRKNKSYATINIAGLAMGMTIFVFASLVANYERTHDAFFEKSSRTYTIGAIVAPGADFGVDRVNSAWTTIAPIVKAELADVEHTARAMITEYLVSVDADGFYQQIRFVDPAFLEIFDFNYIDGDSTVLDDPSAILLTENAAIRYFGRTDVVGEVMSLDNEFDFFVGAVVEDVPLNSHLNSMMIMEAPFEMVLPIKALTKMTDFDEAGNWYNLGVQNMSYVLLPEHLDGDWLQAQLDNMYDRIIPDRAKEILGGFWIVPLQDANTAIWESFGLPVITVIGLLGFLVLIVACVNYTNLATAQSLGRSREVGMRKTMGAGQGQLLVQFLVESMVVATVAMVVAIAVLELVIPLFNNAANKGLTLDYLATLPYLLATILAVGLGAGLYPAWLITRSSPIDALRDTARKGKKGSLMRSLMIGGQFAISAFMLAIVSIVFMQNEKVKQESYEFPRSEIYVLHRLNVEAVNERLDTLRNELEALPNVDSVSYAFQVPYEQTNVTTNVTAVPGDEAGKFAIQQLLMTPEFLDTYDIPVIEGRPLSRDMANDKVMEDDEVANVLINELAVQSLGFASNRDAVNQRFYKLDEQEWNSVREYVIVGVVPTQNITGLFNSEKPWIYSWNESTLRMGSIRISGGNMLETVENIEATWDRIYPEYPMQGRFLDDVFNDVYNVLKLMNSALAGFAFLAVALAMIGLFGLAAFMATQRTKEIGVRKVLGASSAQIARLLVWQFSKPVLWALVVALPAAYFASNIYLNFFADRIESPMLILAVAGAIAVMLAWSTVAGHAFRIARANPVLALRYE
jgi:putative ABC transport system permease protein